MFRGAVETQKSGRHCDGMKRKMHMVTSCRQLNPRVEKMPGLTKVLMLDVYM